MSWVVSDGFVYDSKEHLKKEVDAVKARASSCGLVWASRDHYRRWRYLKNKYAPITPQDLSNSSSIAVSMVGYGVGMAGVLRAP